MKINDLADDLSTVKASHRKHKVFKRERENIEQKTRAVLEK